MNPYRLSQMKCINCYILMDYLLRHQCVIMILKEQPLFLWVLFPKSLLLVFFSFASVSYISGLRLGWIQSKDKLKINKLVSCGLIQSGGGLNPFVSALVNTVLQSGA